MYTFDDWLNDEFILERMPDNNPVFNNSRNYLFLVHQEKMNYGTLNKIQEAQASAYREMVANDFAEKKRLFFQILGSRTEDVVKVKLRQIENFIGTNQQVYDDIILQKKHRGIPIGAVFVTAAQYKKTPLHPLFEVPNSEPYTINGHLAQTVDPARMFKSQMVYVLMESILMFRDWLRTHAYEKPDHVNTILKQVTLSPDILDSDLGVLLACAEEWAITEGYLSKDGTKLKWLGKQMDMAKFIQVLLDERIILRTVSRAVVRDHFISRYKKNLGTDFKLSKIKENKTDFIKLLRKIKETKASLRS